MTGFLLHLLRHGAPALPGRLLGRTDCAATSEGIAACREQVEGLPFDRLVSSDLVRCRDTAMAIDRGAIVDPRWRELDFGDWDGLTTVEIDPAAMAAFWADPDRDPPPGGENWSALVARVAAAIGALDPVDTLVVTHGGAMRAAVSCLCGFDQRQTWALDLPYAALLSIRIWPGERPQGQIVGLC